MKEKFSAFYRYSTEEELKKVWNDEKTLFVFDTNILLSIYSYNTQARDTFFSILESLNGRVWLPFHVVLEYQRNRVKIIKESSSNLENLKRRIIDLDARLNPDEGKINSIETDFHKVYEQHKNIKNDLDEYIVVYKNLLKKTKKELSEITKELFSKFNSADFEIITVDGSDPIRNKFDEIFSSHKVGDCLFKNKDDIQKFNKEANERFKNKIPPGFKDEKEKGDSTFIYAGIEYYNKFGDLIIFKELIEKAKSNTNEIYNLIFVTDDSKDDWIEATKVNDNTIKIGVLSHLKEEFLRESRIKDFKIIDQELFAEHSSKYISSNNYSSVENLITNIKQVKAEKENIINETVEKLISEATHEALDSLNESIMNNRITNLDNSKDYSIIHTNIDEIIQSLEDENEKSNLLNLSNKKIISSIESEVYIRRELEIAVRKLINYSIQNSYFNSKVIEIETNQLSNLIREYNMILNELDFIKNNKENQINTRLTMNNDIDLHKKNLKIQILNLRFHIFNLAKNLVKIIKVQLDVY
ncbi:PIN-like domain-containing protein [Acinetobacter soli]|uniref:PIN-like domain-containing protein n=1 Tax=Acinetobacter soli TaxID=487316 RepID=UPI003A89B3B1